MKNLAIFAALLLVPVFGHAAEVLPTAGKAVGVVKSDVAGKWVIFAEGFTPVVPRIFEGGKVCIFEGPSGRYAVMRIPPGDEQPEVSIVVLGDVIPVPPVVPPVVVVPPEVVPVPPTPAGPRTVLVLRESAEDTPALARLYTSLQAGKASQYLRTKGHSAFVLDDDARDASGMPAPLVEKWKAALSLPLPCLAILDDKGNVLIKATLAPDATDAYVLDLLKAKEAK